MFSRNRKKIRFDKVDTLIGKDACLYGKLEGAGTIRLDGRVEGDISIKGDLILGESGSIVGNIDANNVHVCGQINGNVISKSQLRLTDTAKVYGDVEVCSFVIDDGAVFEGKSKMIPPVNPKASKLAAKEITKEPSEEEKK